MKRHIKYPAFLILTIASILTLTGCVGEYNNIIDYFRSEWRWWNVTIVALVAILIVLLIFLIHAMIHCKVKDKGE